MCPDGVVPLIEAGVITGERKTLHRGKVVAGFVLGTRRIFDCIHDNPIFEFHRDAVHQRSIRDRAERPDGGHQFGDTGGSDRPGVRRFHRHDAVQRIRRTTGLHARRGARPRAASPSSRCLPPPGTGTVSRIVPVLDPGAGVVTSRADVHYVVTEHGVAYLWGKTLRQRAEALIAIADPKFRERALRFCRACALPAERGQQPACQEVA